MSLVLYSGATSPGTLINLYQVEKDYAYIRFDNNTPNHLSINMASKIVDVGEFYSQDVAVVSGFQGTIIVTPSAVITSFSHGQANNLVITGQYAQEVKFPVSQAIPQQAVTTTATGKPIFTAFFGGNSAGNNQSLNIFNPANSGVVAEFHSVKGYTNSPGVPTLNLIYLSGADLNFSGASSAVSQVGSPTPPISVMHVTTDDSNNAFGGIAFEVGRQPGSTTQGTIDLKNFPDTAKLYPGGNMRISLADTSNGHVFALAMKWTEDTIVSPILVTGGQAVASQIDSELLTLGTNLIKSIVPGPLTTYSITNDGVGVHSVDQSGVLHQVEKYNSSGNPLQLGQSGDTTEVLGSLVVDTALSSLGSNSLGATTLNGLLTVGSSGIKIGPLTLVALNTIGDTTIAQAGTSVAHGLGVVPKFVVYTLDGGVNRSDIITVNYGTMTTTNFTAYSNQAGGSGNVRFFVGG